MEFDLSQTWELSVKLRLKAAPPCPDGSLVVSCLRCRHSLDIHQPDADLPDRMLATCPGCQTWHLVNCPLASDELLVIALPDVLLLRKALSSSPSKMANDER